MKDTRKRSAVSTAIARDARINHAVAELWEQPELPTATRWRRAPERVSDSGRAAPALLRARRLLTAQSGFTLIETLVVLAVIGIMMSVSVSWAESVFKTQAQQVQWTQQDDTDLALRDYAGKRIRGAAILGLGEGGDASKTDPLTLAGDQLVIADGTECYRLFYLAAAEEVRARYGDCASVRPQRGPSEASPADPVLDNLASTYLVADHIERTNGAEPVAPLLRYLDANGLSLLYDEQAQSSGPHSALYASRANATAIDAVQLAGWVESASTYATTKPLRFDRRLGVGSAR